MGLVRGTRITRGGLNNKINLYNKGMRTRTNNDEQRLSPEDPNFLGKRCGGIGVWLPRRYRAKGAPYF